MKMENKYIIGCDYSDNDNDFTAVVLFTIVDGQILPINESQHKHINYECT